jgi:hypothetical protein
MAEHLPIGRRQVQCPHEPDLAGPLQVPRHAMTTPFKTTPDQALNLASIMVARREAKRFAEWSRPPHARIVTGLSAPEDGLPNSSSTLETLQPTPTFRGSESCARRPPGRR